jgi:uncharacterized membrane protein YedE/YeeE
VKRLAFFAVLIVILLVGGGLTAQSVSNGDSIKIPALLVSTSNPDASVFQMTSWKAEQLFLLVGFLLFNLVGIALTLTVIFWLLNRQVKRARATDKPTPVNTSDAVVNQS